MELTTFYTLVALVVGIILSKISYSSAQPTSAAGYSNYGSPIERVDRDYVYSYGQPLTPDRLSRLRRGYYYVDDGYIAPVSNGAATSSSRRQDGNTSGSGIKRYSPIVRYQETRTKRKKLFVPNLFG